MLDLRFAHVLQQDAKMSHSVAVGTLPALLINIANPKVQKNVPFENWTKTEEENYVCA